MRECEARVASLSHDEAGIMEGRRKPLNAAFRRGKQCPKREKKKEANIAGMRGIYVAKAQVLFAIKTHGFVREAKRNADSVGESSENDCEEKRFGIDSFARHPPRFWVDKWKRGRRRRSEVRGRPPGGQFEEWQEAGETLHLFHSLSVSLPLLVPHT